ncbi:MAG: hypothetical protein LBB79_07945 [Prevotellaceae bacterium]|nr:hypothetical protein [Prevotellaceae bacterium]
MTWHFAQRRRCARAQLWGENRRRAGRFAPPEAREKICAGLLNPRRLRAKAANLRSYQARSNFRRCII